MEAPRAKPAFPETKSALVEAKPVFEAKPTFTKPQSAVPETTPTLAELKLPTLNQNSQAVVRAVPQENNATPQLQLNQFVRPTESPAAMRPTSTMPLPLPRHLPKEAPTAEVEKLVTAEQPKPISLSPAPAVPVTSNAQTDEPVSHAVLPELPALEQPASKVAASAPVMPLKIQLSAPRQETPAAESLPEAFQTPADQPAIAKAIAIEPAPAKSPGRTSPKVQTAQNMAPVHQKVATPESLQELEGASRRPLIRQTDFSTAIGASAFNRQPPAEEMPAETPDIEFGQLPEGSPFEAISQSGTIKLRVRRSLLMRTKVDIYRTAIVDDSVVELAQFTPREISLIGRSQGQTHVTFWFDDPNMQPVTYLVEVAIDEVAEKRDQDKYKLLETVVNEMFPDSKVYLVLVADKLLVKGQARDSEEAAQIMSIIRAQSGGYGMGAPGYGGLTQGFATPVLSQSVTGGQVGPSYTVINMLRVPGVQQVALRVKIAELNRTAARGFGVDVVGEIDLSSAADGSKLFLASLLNASSAGGTALLAQVDGDDLDIGIRYLQQRGVVKLLSEPTLVTLSGRPATFVAGGEFAVPTIVGSVGLNAVTTDFRAFGAIISFLPTVVDKDRIRLQVAPEFSQINNNLEVGGTPGLNVRSATTTVEMREGQTLAIAGLLEDTYKATTVGDLPFLAQIFGRRDTTRSETELIILVTPELVQPMEPEEVPPLPGFDVTEPNACQFFYHGDIEGNPTRDHRSTVWPRLRKRYGMGGPAMTSGPFGHGQ